MARRFEDPSQQSLIQPSTDDALWRQIEFWSSRSSELFVKKLSRNDTSWAEDTHKHQAGFYIPAEIRSSSFFPRLSADNPEKPHILHADCPVLWPQTGEVSPSGLRHYTIKGPETHFTRIPKELFTGLSPASLLVGGKLKSADAGYQHWFVVLDSQGDTAEFLETALELASNFHFGLFEPTRIKPASLPPDELAELIDQIRSAVRGGRLEAFLNTVVRLPPPDEIASAAQASYLQRNGLKLMNPFEIECPGDAIMLISRDIEYSIFRKYELRRRTTEVVSALLSTSDDLITSVVRGFPSLDAVFLSASQQRKTRAGRSFENHIARTLRDGNVQFEEQAVMGGRRPDFVLPDSKTLRKRQRDFNGAAILSAKTTLRERWKQLSREAFNAQIYLATVDDRVAAHSIDEMAAQGIMLVVPEALKSSKETCYPKNGNVISFRQFFDTEVSRKRPFLLKQAQPCRRS